jgi:protoporphyrinogen oxidase
MRNLIIGSGITGLTIGKVLTNKKIGFKILESQSEIGGRLQTSLISGHFVDVGFQVLLRKYPALKLFPEINELDFMDMKSGFIIYKNGSFYKILNPLRNILGLIYYNKFPGFSLKDKLLLIKILTLSKPLNKEIKTLEYLEEYGFSKTFINDFFISFFQGVFLDTKLNVPLDYFLFILRLFSHSKVSIPIGGISKITSVILDKIDKNKIILNTEVIKVLENKVLCSDGKEITFDKLICTSHMIEKTFIKKINKDIFKDIKYNGTLCFYYLIKINNIEDRIIYLFPKSNNISSLYFKKIKEGEYLLCISSLNKNCSYLDIENEIFSYFNKIDSIKLLKSFTVNNGLPIMENFYKYKNKSFMKYSDNIFFAGDFLSTPSLNGAIESGINVSEVIS